jgi:hypothetical protein
MRCNLHAYDQVLRLRIKAEWLTRDLENTPFAQTAFDMGGAAAAAAPLAWSWRILWMLLPFPTPLHILLPAIMLDRGNLGKARDMNRFWMIGLGIWYWLFIALVRGVHLISQAT